jgi:hypothetical protein
MSNENDSEDLRRSLLTELNEDSRLGRIYGSSEGSGARLTSAQVALATSALAAAAAGGAVAGLLADAGLTGLAREASKRALRQVRNQKDSAGSASSRGAELGRIVETALGETRARAGATPSAPAQLSLDTVVYGEDEQRQLVQDPRGLASEPAEDSRAYAPPSLDSLISAAPLEPRGRRR